MKNEILEIIFSEFPTQKKKITTFFGNSPGMEEDLDIFLDTYANFMELENITPKKLAEAYIEMLNQMIFARKEFIHSGEYLSRAQSEAFDHTYDNEEFMTNYMIALALSQFLWKHHYEVYNFFKNIISGLDPKSNILEVGSGHGLFLLEILKIINKNNVIDVVDISKSSIRMTKNIIKSIDEKLARHINFYLSDINHFKSNKKYNFVTLGEVIEHVDNPLKVLEGFHDLLDDDGVLFISTCANCPTIDHVYLFSNISDIRALIKEAGFEIDSEIISPTEDKSDEYLRKYKVDISYAALLKKTRLHNGNKR
jgi:2-polyprenyl-3-methyl-5-hydroxy-6-metoxy-1,4-benzoquinol methylase